MAADVQDPKSWDACPAWVWTLDVQNRLSSWPTDRPCKLEVILFRCSHSTEPFHAFTLYTVFEINVKFKTFSLGQLQPNLAQSIALCFYLFWCSREHMYLYLKENWMQLLTWNNIILFLLTPGKFKMYNMTVILQVSASENGAVKQGRQDWKKYSF